MDVAAVQFRPTKGDLDGSRGRLREWADRAAEGADLLVLPEMAATGYWFPTRPDAAAVCEPADGPTLAALAPVARAHRCWLVAGFGEVDGDTLFNSALVVDPAGELAFVYRKTLLFDADLPWATPGDSGYRAFDTDAGRFGVGICMDLNDDGFVDWCAGAGLDAIAFPTNWVEEHLPVWNYWAWRLQKVDGALVAANTWGSDGPLTFCGRSAVLQRRTLLAAAEPTADAIIRARLGAATAR